jgi:hypothetical protein
MRRPPLAVFAAVVVAALVLLSMPAWAVSAPDVATSTPTVAPAATRQAFGPPHDAGTAISFGLLVGIALLAASIAVVPLRD